MSLNISIGSDHAGYSYKNEIKQHLENTFQFSVQDNGTFTEESCDYPDYAHQVAKSVQDGKADFGVLICGSANGVCMTANKHQLVRAAIAWLPEIASLAKQHNNANVICIPARFVAVDEAKKIIDAFFEAEFEGGRHQRRVDKIPVS